VSAVQRHHTRACICVYKMASTHLRIPEGQWVSMRVYKIMNMHMSAEPRDDVITHPPFGMHAVTETKMRLTHVEHIHASY